MSKEQEAEMERRSTILLPLVHERDASKLAKAAADLDLSISQVYRMLRDFRENGKDLRAFAGRCPTGGRGKPRISPEQEAAIATIIQLKILRRNPKKPKPKISQLYQILGWICQRSKPPVKTPSYNSVAARLQALTPQRISDLMNRIKPSRRRHLIAAGEFPEATHPLQCILIDNFCVDLIIVDAKFRKSIGRPCLTLAIDAYSRMVVGYYLSMDDPSTLSVGLCLMTVIKKKEEVLKRLGIEAKWSAFGMPVLVHTDNGSDFISAAFRNACKGREIEIANRPVHNPEMGGLVERWGGTFNGKFWEFPGATFNNAQVRGDYDAESDGSITLDELERMTVRLIIAYHHDFHRGIKCSPEAKWEEGIIGDDDNFGIGIPEIPGDIDNLYFEILPMATRKIGKRGIVWDDLWYFCSELPDLLLERDPKDPQKMREFVVKRDPRSLKQIYLQLPRSDRFITIPWTHKNRRDVNLWDYRFSKAEAVRLGKDTRDPDVILRMNEEIRAQIEQSEKLTKKERRTLDRLPRKPESPKPAISATESPLPENSEEPAVTPSPVEPESLAAAEPPSPYDESITF
jgi:putative transposase